MKNDDLDIRIKKVLKQGMHRGHIVTLFASVIFLSLAIGLTVVFFSQFSSIPPVSVIIIFTLFISGFSAFGICFLVYSLNRIISYLRSLNILQNGSESTAQICDYSVSHATFGIVKYSGNYDSHYSLTLKFTDNHQKHTFKTVPIYTNKQLELLQSLSQIKIKHIKNKAVIIEEFPKEPPPLTLSDYPKHIRIKIVLVQIYVYFSLLLIVASIVILLTLKQNWLAFVALPNLPIAALTKAFLINHLRNTKYSKNKYKQSKYKYKHK